MIIFRVLFTQTSVVRWDFVARARHFWWERIEHIFVKLCYFKMQDILCLQGKTLQTQYWSLWQDGISYSSGMPQNLLLVMYGERLLVCPATCITYFFQRYSFRPCIGGRSWSRRVRYKTGINTCTYHHLFDPSRYSVLRYTPMGFLGTEEQSRIISLILSLFQILSKVCDNTQLGFLMINPKFQGC